MFDIEALALIIVLRSHYNTIRSNWTLIPNDVIYEGGV